METDVLVPMQGEVSVLPKITEREREVLLCMALGYSNKQIAGKLDMSERTAKFHVHHVLGKLKAHNRTQAVIKGLRYKFISLDGIDL